MLTMDYTPQLNELLEKQQAILDKQTEMIEQLQNQTAVLLEQVNGFTLIANMIYSIIGIILIFVCGFAIWKIISRWFFRGI